MAEKSVDMLVSTELKMWVILIAILIMATLSHLQVIMTLPLSKTNSMNLSHFKTLGLNLNF